MMNLLRPLNLTFGGTPAGLHLPILVPLAVALLVATVWFTQKALHRQMARGWVAPRLFQQLVPGRAPGREAAKVALVGAGLTLLAIACAGPYWGEVKQLAHCRGVDIVVALDASRSMLAKDVEPDRLTQARVAVESLIDKLHGDRIGLVTFAKGAFVQAPLTTDYAAARLYLRAVDPMQMQQGGTDVGGALSESLELLQRVQRGQRQQVVVLLTDGEDWGSTAGAQAKELGAAGIHLYTVAVGSAAGAPVPELDDQGREVGVLRDQDGAAVMSHANRAALAALANEANGQSFDLATDLGVGALSRAIDSLQKSDIEDFVISAGAERFTWFALPALALMALGLWLSPARRRRLPPALASLALLALPVHARADLLHRPDPEAAAGAQAFAAGDYQAALKHFQAKTAHPEDARFNRGDALAGLGKTEEALEAFKPDAPTLRGRDAYNRGTLEAQTGHRDEAIASLRRALSADPSNDDARHNLEVLLAKQDDPSPKDQQQKPGNKDSKAPQKSGGGSKGEGQQGKGDEPKNQSPGPPAQKDQTDKGRNGRDQSSKGGENQDAKGQQARNPGDVGQGGEPAQTGAQGQPGQQAIDQPREATDSERMLDALKAGDRLLPYQNVQPERSAPDAHPW